VRCWHPSSSSLDPTSFQIAFAIEADRVDSLNLDDAIAAAAGHPQHVARDLG
jgi:hypothetical protein